MLVRCNYDMRTFNPMTYGYGTAEGDAMLDAMLDADMARDYAELVDPEEEDRIRCEACEGLFQDEV